MDDTLLIQVGAVVKWKTTGQYYLIRLIQKPSGSHGYQTPIKGDTVYSRWDSKHANGRGKSPDPNRYNNIQGDSLLRGDYLYVDDILEPNLKYRFAGELPNTWQEWKDTLLDYSLDSKIISPEHIYKVDNLAGKLYQHESIKRWVENRSNQMILNVPLTVESAEKLNQIHKEFGA